MKKDKFENLKVAFFVIVTFVFFFLYPLDTLKRKSTCMLRPLLLASKESKHENHRNH